MTGTSPNGINGVSDETAKTTLSEPLKYQGTLDHLKFVDSTTAVGREFAQDVQIVDLLAADNSDAMIKDLAAIISQRGVVFFRNQDLSIEKQKEFVNRISEASGRPKSSSLHVHPLYHSPENEPMNDKGEHDPEVYVVSNKAMAKMYKEMQHRNMVTDASRGWHTDGTWEEATPDYSCLIMRETPPSGGDTLWSSATHLYDKISPSFSEYLSTLTCTCAQPVFVQSATRNNIEIMSPRGSPLNVGNAFSAIHPVVRTNPVTGLRSIFAVGLHCSKINDVHPEEDKMIRDYFLQLITHGHDFQVRYKWNPNDVAIWDNRSVFHAATPDLVGRGIRFGNRVTSVGEKPYFDPKSLGRREAIQAGVVAY